MREGNGGALGDVLWGVIGPSRTLVRDVGGYPRPPSWKTARRWAIVPVPPKLSGLWQAFVTERGGEPETRTHNTQPLSAECCSCRY